MGMGGTTRFDTLGRELRSESTLAKAGQPQAGIVVKDAEGRESVVTSVRQVGAKTFYFKNNRWVDSTVTPEQDAKATVIAQFSDAFFKLAATQKTELNQYLTFQEPVTVNLDGQVYRFEQAKP
jgi:Ca-activated chloride channel family protein